jgi:hypothetical protein
VIVCGGSLKCMFIVVSISAAGPNGTRTRIRRQRALRRWLRVPWCEVR